MRPKGVFPAVTDTQATAITEFFRKVLPAQYKIADSQLQLATGKPTDEIWRQVDAERQGAGYDALERYARAVTGVASRGGAVAALLVERFPRLQGGAAGAFPFLVKVLLARDGIRRAPERFPDLKDLPPSEIVNKVDHPAPPSAAQPSDATRQFLQQAEEVAGLAEGSLERAVPGQTDDSNLGYVAASAQLMTDQLADGGVVGPDQASRAPENVARVYDAVVLSTTAYDRVTTFDRVNAAAAFEAALPDTAATALASAAPDAPTRAEALANVYSNLPTDVREPMIQYRSTSPSDLGVVQERVTDETDRLERSGDAQPDAQPGAPLERVMSEVSAAAPSAAPQALLLGGGVEVSGSAPGVLLLPHEPAWPGLRTIATTFRPEWNPATRTDRACLCSLSGRLAKDGAIQTAELSLLISADRRSLVVEYTVPKTPGSVDASNTPQAFTLPGGFTDDTFHTIALLLDYDNQDDIQVSVDGAQPVNVGPLPTFDFRLDSVAVGRRGSGERFDGHMLSLTIWSRVLAPNETVSPIGEQGLVGVLSYRSGAPTFAFRADPSGVWVSQFAQPWTPEPRQRELPGVAPANHCVYETPAYLGVFWHEAGFLCTAGDGSVMSLAPVPGSMSRFAASPMPGLVPPTTAPPFLVEVILATSVRDDGSLQVDRWLVILAQAVSTQDYADPAVTRFTTIGTSVTLTVGGDSKLLDLTKDNSLNGVAAAINAAADSDFVVSAEVRTDGSGHRLVVTGNVKGRELSLVDASAAALLQPPTNTAPFLADVYGPVLKKVEVKSGNTLHNQFATKPPGIDYCLAAYDVSKMDPMRPWDRLGTNIFKYPDLDSCQYDITQSLTIPFGWELDPLAQTSGGYRSVFCQTESDLANVTNTSDNINVNVGIWQVHRNAATEQQTETMRDKEASFSYHWVFVTKDTVVLDKANVSLDLSVDANGVESGFLHDVRRMLDPDDDYSAADIIDTYGTHYVNAARSGARGSAVEKYTKDSLATLLRQGTNLSWGVGAHIQGSVSAEGVNVDYNFGADYSQTQANASTTQMKSVMGDDFGTFTCVGSSSCNDGTLGDPGSEAIPVMVDLRPLTELLGPPFFNDFDSCVTARRKLFAALDAYLGYSPSQQPAVRWRVIRGGFAVTSSTPTTSSVRYYPAGKRENAGTTSPVEKFLDIFVSGPDDPDDPHGWVLEVELDAVATSPSGSDYQMAFVGTMAMDEAVAKFGPAAGAPASMTVSPDPSQTMGKLVTVPLASVEPFAFDLADMNAVFSRGLDAGTLPQ